jgi:potassium efflux system protein
MAIPLVLAGLAFLGYYYGALKLAELVIHTLMVLFGLSLLHGMVRRRLMIAQRRLALRRAQERRAALQESRAKERESSSDTIFEGIPVEIEEQVDLETIDGQSRTMLRMVIGVLAAVLLSLLWSELIPALGGLDDIVLWEHSSGADGEVGQGVTLWSLLLALFVLGITLVAANNLPGVLEIAVLQPLEVEPGNRYAISLLSRYFIVSVGMLSGFVLIGLGWGDVQWLVAAMGVGLGFGLKEIFANFFSGLILLFERPIRIGDWVSIGGLSGSVTRIRIRATTVTDWDNRELIIPNKNFLTEVLNNWSLSDSITRVVVKVGIAYGSDTEKALGLMQDVVDAHPDAMKDPAPSVLFLGFGDSSLNFEIRVYVEDPLRRLSLTHDLHMKVDQVFRREGIEIPFPQRDLHLRSIDPQARFRIAADDSQPLSGEPSG